MKRSTWKTSPPTGVLLTMLLAIAAIALCVGLASSYFYSLAMETSYEYSRSPITGSYPPQQPVVQRIYEPSAFPNRCEPASLEDARALMLKLFPKAAFFETSDISNDGTESCLRRVDMMTDWGNPATRGTVYVLADGNHFLNGPLMNSESVLIDTSSAQPSPVAQNEPASSSAPADDLAFLAHALELLEKYENMPDTDQTVEEQKADLLDALTLMPNQTVFHEGNPNTVYVVYDTACPRCHELFAMQDDIAEQYGARLVWIPTYLNEESRKVAAGLLQLGGTSELLAAVMGGDTTGLPDTPTEASFAQLEASAGYLRDLAVEHGFGTPLIVFQHAVGTGIELINGIPPISEFAPLAAPAL